MKHAVTTNVHEPRIVKMSEMKPGQIGVVTSRTYDGLVVICTYGGRIADLSSGDTWSDNPNNTNEVRLLPPGATVTIVVGG